MSDKKIWEKIESIVDEALSLPASQRQDFVNRQCRNESELLAEVSLLLDSISDSEGWLEDPGQYKKDFYNELRDDSAPPAPGSSLIDKRIGPYRVKQLLGEGGMGLVYLAERTDGAFEHQVALKVIREGMDTQNNIRRFRQERNILAGLNHPNIAGILDGGVTEEGLPYLIMEYVDGIPLDTYCEKHQCTVKERIGLFKSVCHAVQHAHNNLVIHRDLKPGNILVDSRGQIKVLDFGIAKLLDADTSGTSHLRTRTGARILTISYAAPEQISKKNITTAVDNYALGILLYKLLTGVLPFDKEGKTISEIEDQILKASPLKPSVRFAKLPQDYRRKFSQQMRITPAGVEQRLKGDLDAIILKNLRKEPETRYNSPHHLIEDLERHEKALPVRAREGTLRYRTSKLFRRHRVSIAASVIAMMTIIGFILFHTHQVTLERNRAQLEAEKAEQVTEFLIDLIGKNYPENARGDTITVREVLENSLEEIKTLDNPAPVKAKIMSVIGHVYRTLGEFEKAKPLLEESVKLSQTESNSPTVELAKSYNILGIIVRDEGNYAQAAKYLRQSVEIYRELNLHENGAYAKALKDLAYVKRQEGKYDTALVYSREALSVEKSIYGESNMQVAETLFILAGIYKSLGDYGNAETYQRRSLEICRKEIGEPHPGTAANLNNLGILLKLKNDLQAAKKVYFEALEMNILLYGENHKEVAHSLGNLSQVYRELGKLDSAFHFANRSLSVAVKALGSEHLTTSYQLENVADVYLEKRMFSKADSLYNKALSIQQSHLPPHHSSLISTLVKVARTHFYRSSLDSAEYYIERANDYLSESDLPQNHPLRETIGSLSMDIRAAMAED